MSLVTKKNPVGKDWYIRKLQEWLYAKLVAKWGSDVVYDCYGRVYRNKTDNGYRAEVYKGRGEYSDVYWDDSKQVISFFGVAPTEQISEDAEVDVHLVFFVNLDFKSATKRNDEEIRRDVYSILKKDPFGFQLKESHTGIENCLTEYPGTSRDERLKFFDMHPGHVFRFDMNLRYDPDMCYEITETEDEDVPGETPAGDVENFTDVAYDQVTGELVWSGTEAGDYLTQIYYLDPVTGQPYVNGEGNLLTVGAFPGTGYTETQFTPGDVVLKWRRVSTVSFTPLTDWVEYTLTVERLAKRYVKLRRLSTNDVLQTITSYTVYNRVNNAIAGDPVTNLADIVTRWNSDGVNTSFATIETAEAYPSESSVQYYRFLLAPVESATTYLAGAIYVDF
jgi:hypothetical protein